jgi:hypothetical protein
MSLGSQGWFACARGYMMVSCRPDKPPLLALRTLQQSIINTTKSEGQCLPGSLCLLEYFDDMTLSCAVWLSTPALDGRQRAGSLIFGGQSEKISSFDLATPTTRCEQYVSNSMELGSGPKYEQSRHRNKAQRQPPFLTGYQNAGHAVDPESRAFADAEPQTPLKTWSVPDHRQSQSELDNDRIEIGPSTLLLSGDWLAWSSAQRGSKSLNGLAATGL